VITRSKLTGAEDIRTDEELVELALAGQGDLFARIYQRYYSRAYRLAYAMTGRREAAEDLAQEMFIRAWRKIDQFRGEASFSTWFYRLAINCSLNYRKREKRQSFDDSERIESIPQAGAARQVEAKILQRQIQTEVHRAVLSLKPKLRVIVVLKDIEGLSYAEIAERVNCSEGTIASRLNRARYAHTATLLTDGRVLVAGGMDEERTATGSAEIFDPVTKTFTLIASLYAKRVGHTATRLQDGRVLITGGSGVIFYESALASAEIFDPATGLFTKTANLHAARLGHRAVLLRDGKVLVTGGQAEDGAKIASAEIFDPQTGAFTSIRNMNTPRSDHTMTLLRDGKVLIAGGANSISTGREVVTATAEIFDPVTSLFTKTADMNMVRYKHSATLLPDGKVLILGGSNALLARGMYPSAEIFDPSAGLFSMVGNMLTSRYKIRDAVALLKDGKVIVAGGGSRVEIYDPSTGLFSAVAGGIGSPRYYSTATLLASGEVLVAGGYSNSRGMFPNASAWIYSPADKK